MSIEIDTDTFFEKFLRRNVINVDKDSLLVSCKDVPYISIEIWKSLPDHAIQILEQAGYTKYDRNTDSIVFVKK